MLNKEKLENIVEGKDQNLKKIGGEDLHKEKHSHNVVLYLKMFNVQRAFL